MKGTKTQRGPNKWLLRISADGERYVETFNGAAKEADKRLRELHGLQEQKKLPTRRNLTVNEALDYWLENGPQVEEQSLAHYADMMAWYVRPVLGKTKLDKLEATAIQDLYTQMKKIDLSDRTRRMTHNILKAALRRSVKWGFLSHNPCDDVVAPPDGREISSRAFDIPQIRRFLEAAQHHRLSVLWRLALGTAMRPEEYLSLQWDDVNWQDRRIFVRRALIRIKGPREEGTPSWRLGSTKTGVNRWVPLAPGLMADLKLLHIQDQQQRDGWARKGKRPWNPEHFIFAGRSGQPLRINNLNRRGMREVCHAAGLGDQHTLYVLRRSCATLLIEKGHSPKLVAEWLGNSVGVVLKHYVRVTGASLDAAVASVEDILFPRLREAEMDRELAQWVESRGGADFLAGLAREARKRELDQNLDQATADLVLA